MESREIDELLRQAGYDPESVEQQFSMYAQKCAEVLQLRAENARLRAALDRVSAKCSIAVLDYEAVVGEIADIADQALRGGL